MSHEQKLIERLRRRCLHMERWLKAIRDFKPYEIAHDAYAYRRLVASYRKAARNGLKRPEKKEPPCPTT